MKLKRILNALSNRVSTLIWLGRALGWLSGRSASDSSAETVLIFAPEGAVVPHLIGLCIIARTLIVLGYKVKLVRCFDLQKRCVAMDMAGFPYRAAFLQRVNFCLNCLAQSLRVAAFYGVEAIDLREFVTDDVRALATNSLTFMPKDIRDFTFDGIPFGKISMGNLALVSKTQLDDKISDELRSMWLDNVETTLLIYNSLTLLMRQLQISRVIYFNDYPVNLVARILAEKNNIPCFTLSYVSHKNVDRTRFVFFPIHTRGRYFFQRSLWDQWKAIPLNAQRVEMLTDDIIHRISGVGSHIYSPGKSFSDIREALEVPNGKKLIAAYTSSLDEVVAGLATSEAVGFKLNPPPQPFGSDLDAMQLYWLRTLVKQAAEWEDRYLVIRIHPREGAVKGEKMASQRFRQLKSEFAGELRNCRIVWPEDPTSSFDLGEIADLVLVTWSTIGVEMARLGVPVLAATYGISPFPNDLFLAFEENQKAYFDRLDAMMTHAPGVEALKLAYRWTNLFYHGNALDLGDVVTGHTTSAQLPAYRFPRDAKQIDDVLSGRRDILDINFERLVNSHGDDPKGEEMVAVSAQINRLVNFLCTGKDRMPGGLILFRADTVPSEVSLEHLSGSYDRSIALMVCWNQHIYYLFDGCVVSRFSPMILRLAEIGAKKKMEFPAV